MKQICSKNLWHFESLISGKNYKEYWITDNFIQQIQDVCQQYIDCLSWLVCFKVILCSPVGKKMHKDEKDRICKIQIEEEVLADLSEAPSVT